MLKSYWEMLKDFMSGLLPVARQLEEVVDTVEEVIEEVIETVEELVEDEEAKDSVDTKG